MATYDRIEINPNIMLGKPVIRGTRIPVELILRKLSEKATEADLMDAYPQLVTEDIQAAIRFAADTIAQEETVIVSRKASWDFFTMRFLVDESCDIVLSQALLEDGNDVLDVRDSKPGANDEWVINFALSENRILLTEDKDFGRLIYAHGHKAIGVIFCDIQFQNDIE